ncbi:hypothetical protein FBU59_006906 [Linderina macrospora]|uniref:Uncharacterized protein n=1 Tax=Linderina macrospora TaxID=4868 RepID=A0ACC1IYG6_9FUNG|nr:hypothetical protein FBU59_006906 [Linderina macrospora]
MRQFDYEPRDPSDPLYVRSERQHIDSLVERMRNMTSLASPSEMSGVAQQILSYVETESRRRQMQSERHDRIVSTLAEIIASTPASTPITNTASRRSSVMQEWVQQPVAGSRRGSETQQLVLMPAVRSNLPPASSSAVEEAHGAVADTVFVQPRFHTTASRSESLPTISPIMSSRASPAASDAQTANQPASRASN